MGSMHNKSLGTTRGTNTFWGVVLWGIMATTLSLIPWPHTANASVSSSDKPIPIIIRDDGFSPNEITDSIHKSIHLKIINRGRHIHEFAIPEYRIYTRNLHPGETSDIQFSPWQAGSFVMYSDPASDNHPEFSGRFIVVPNDPEDYQSS